jgi:nicotinamide-nucleotide amidase
MKAEIITSGTELLLGEVVDTNTPYLARELAAIGVSVYHHTTVGDNPRRLLEAIQLAEKRADIIIVSGGLGPTQDDITKSILAEHLNDELVIDEASYEKATTRYATDEISEGNYRQALVLEGSTPLKNEVGMAAGIYTEENNHTYILLPGPPNEFEHMVSNYLLPKLSETVGDGNMLRSRNMNFYGLPESTLAERLDELIQNQSNPTIAVYAKNGVIDVRLTASAKTSEACEVLLDEMEERVLAIIGDHFFSYGKTRLHDVAFEELAQNDESIAIFEVLTDGATTDYWSRELEHPEVFKGGNVFTKISHAHTFYQLEQSADLTPAALNEQYAKAVQKAYQADYGVAVRGWGRENLENKDQERIAWMSIALPDGEVLTKKVDYSRSQNPARWMLSLRVSDFVRRHILGLPELPERY